MLVGPAALVFTAFWAGDGDLAVMRTAGIKSHEMTGDDQGSECRKGREEDQGLRAKPFRGERGGGASNTG